MLNLDSSCLAFWLFNGNGDDATPNNHDLNLTGTMTYVPAASGPFGTLTGCTPDENNYWAAGAAFRTAFSSSADFTVFSHIRGSAFTVANACMSWGTANAGQVCVPYPCNSSGGPGMAVYCNGGGYKFDLNAGKPAINEWHSFALSVLSDESAILYLDGVQVATSALDLTNFPAMTAFQIGRYHNGGQPWNGSTGPTGVWEPHLSAEEIAIVAAGAVFPFTPPPSGSAGYFGTGLGLSLGL